MTTALRREERLVGPSLPTDRLPLQPPPEIVPHEGSGGALMTALPMLGSVGSIVFVAASQPGPRGFIAAGMFLVASLGFVVVSIQRQRAQRQGKVLAERRAYLRYLGEVRAMAREAAGQQRSAQTWTHPDPVHLPALAEERTRVWERSPGDGDFLQVRYGVAAQPLALELVAPESAPIDLLDPVSASALHRLLVTHRVQPDLPAALDLRAFSRVEVTGDDAGQVRALARSLVCSAVALHAPSDLRVAVLCSPEALGEWEWLKWLPHAGSPTERDAAGPARMVATSMADLVPLLPGDLTDRPRFSRRHDGRTSPQVLVVLDGVPVPIGDPVITEDGVLGVTVLDLPEVWADLEDDTRLRMHLTGAVRPDGRVSLSLLRVREEPLVAAGDQVDTSSAEALARRLAPLDTGDGPRADTSSQSAELLDLLGLGDVRSLDLETAWRLRPPRDRLRVPVGLAADGSPAYLDIKEAAQQGMGPHGLVVGATGSGKSELLRTLVLAMALTHSPEQLNLVLIDFKGGATFAGMSDLPHVSAVITNLEKELFLVNRMADALQGEMVRRQTLLRESGNYASLREYERARAAGEDLAPLPSLFIVVDEFSELLSAKPEFAELFVAIGRLGRSLGLHLLLASQRLEEGRLRGLESHLSYRVGLKTFSEGESRTVLGVPDAHHLPSVPGLGYLKPDPSTLTRFKASYVSGPPPRRSVVSADGSTTTAVEVLPYTLAPVQRAVVPQQQVDEPAVERSSASEVQPSIIDIAVERMAGHGPEAHKVWLAPLDLSNPLDSLLPDLAVDERLGLVSASWRALPGLVLPVGVVDKPLEQSRETLAIDLGGAAGHVAVVGGPRSGKSTVARTILTSLALTRTPLEVQYYVLDFGGGTFSSLRELPHLAGVASRDEPDVVRRIVAEVQGVLSARERYFREQGVDSIDTYRRRRAAGELDDGYGDVLLVVDGWSTLRAEFDEMEMELQQLAGRGLTYGVHLVATASRWGDFRPAVRDVLLTRLELRLGDPSESEIERKLAVDVPAGRPGRGLVTSRHHFLAAQPRIDGSSDATGIGEAATALSREVAAAWRGPQPPKLRLLRDLVPLQEVLEGRPADDRRLVLGVDERALAPVAIDVDEEAHLLVFGDGGSGKTNLLRTYVREVMRTRTPAQAQIVVVSYRRSLLGEIPEEYLLDYFPNAATAVPGLEELAAYLRQRGPGPDITAEQLRTRSWLTGAEAFVVVDDYDLVATSAGSALRPLTDLLPQASDVGLHVVVARRSGGAARALHEPVVQGLRDLASPSLLLAGDPNEGPLIGNLRPRPNVPGRGHLVTRSRGTGVVQVAWSPPTH